MLKIIKTIVKRIIVSVFLLYGLNLIVSALDFTLPINVFSILLTGLLGLPGLCTLVALYFIV